MMKLAADAQAGKMPKIGPRVDGSQAEYTYMTLTDLIALAYKVKNYQISGPDWLANTRFDIIAKLPEGASKDDAPQMLQALLAERFKMSLHRETKDHPVLALVVGKGGPKLQASPPPEAIDENTPLKPGERSMDTPEGPVRVSASKDGRGGTMNMGKNGTMTFKMEMGDGNDPNSMSMHMDFSQVTLEGFADMLTRFSQQLGGGAAGRPIKDMTGLTGNYQVSLTISMADLMAMARNAGVDIPGSEAAAASSSPGANTAAEPRGGTTFTEAVESLGLKLEKRSAPVEQLIIEHVEKTPIEN
jgi:uncharacterized protein (TIGR03435 family)